MGLLVLSAVVAVLGFALVCLAQDLSLMRVLRVATVPGALIVAGFLLHFSSPYRDRLLLPFVSLLCSFSIIILWRLDPDLASKQVVWMLLGVCAMLAVAYLLDDIRDLMRFKYTAGILAALLMIVTMIWGIERNGARLWLGMEGLFIFQPGELAKVLICIFLAGYVAEKGDIIRAQVQSRPGMTFPGMRYVGPMLVVVMFSLAILVVQRDLGAAALFFGLFVSVTYLATGRKTYALLSVILFVLGMVAAYYMFGHVRVRFNAWMDPWYDPQGGGYQILQGLFALAAGGMSGVGLGSGLPSTIPAASTDMIYVIIGEELGLLGAVAVLLLYVLVTMRAYAISWSVRGTFPALLGACIATVMSLQTLVIIGGVLRVIPLTGITMPFVSYGGTSVVVSFIMLGLLLVISRDCPTVGEKQ